MEALHTLLPVMILLLVGVLAIMLMRPLNLSPIVGYLLAGMLIGPHGLKLIQEGETTHLLSELGVVFLLFDIGLHFSLAQIWDARRDILGLGPLQVLLCTLAFGAIAWAIGLPLGLALIVGASLALSSTAVASQTMADHHQSHSPVGTSATAVLIFQDILAIFLLILASSMSAENEALGSVISLAALKALAAFAAAMLIGHYLITPLFRLVAKFRDEELLTAITLLIVLATATATGALELSLTLGAFLAGMIIGETPYRHLIQTEIKPFRGLLLGFFFITIGMLLDLHSIFENWWIILLVGFVMITLKLVFIFVAARLLNTTPQSAFQISVLLAQGSEFAFVLFAMPALRDALGPETIAILITAIALSMALTPPLWIFGHKLAERWAHRWWEQSKAERRPKSNSDISVMIIGMGEIGQRIADGLVAHSIPYRAIENNHDRFVNASADGYAVAFGNATDLRILQTLKVAHAKIVVVTFSHFAHADTISPRVKQRYPELHQMIAVPNEEQQARFTNTDIQAVISRGFPRGIDIAAAVLMQQGVAAEKVEKWMRRQQEIELEEQQSSDLSLQDEVIAIKQRRKQQPSNKG